MVPVAGETSEVKIPAPSTSLRASSVAKSATRVGHPSGSGAGYFVVEVKLRPSIRSSTSSSVPPITVIEMA